SAQNGTSVTGTVTLGAPSGNSFTVSATLNGLTAGQVPTLIIPTTSGTVTTAGSAAVAGTPVTINTSLTGVPLANGLVLVTVNTPGPGQLVSQGTVTCGTTPVGATTTSTATLTAQNGSAVSGTVTLSVPTNNTFTVTATLN